MNIKKFIYQKSKIFNLFKIFGGYSFQPFFLLIHLTLDCNCHCQYCYQKDNSFYINHNAFISPADFKNILSDIKNSFLIKPKLHFFGGEPLINPYFPQLLDLTQDYQMKTSMTTNGILLSKYLDQILKSDLNQINISIDDIGQKHDQLRQFKGCFQKAIDNIKELRDKEEKKRKIININCLITSNNHRHLVDLATYFKDNMIDIDVLVFQHMYSNHLASNYQIDLNILKSQIKELKSLEANFDILLIPEIKHKDLVVYYSIDDKKVFKNNCNIPWLGLNILPDLKVTPGGGVLSCNHIVGDLKEQTLKEIWNNSSIKRFRKNIIRNGLDQACSRCCHRQYY